ncbi:MAG: sugar transferase [Muribaculaceae bacterium]|nr:sugar transferase [Muribaculaceae bacterium]
MKSDSRHSAIYIVSDFISTSLAWLLFNIVRYTTLDPVNNFTSLGNYLLYPLVLAGQFVVPLMMMALYWLSGYYNKAFVKSRIESIMTTLGSTLIGTVIIYFIAIIDDPIPDRYSNYELVLILEGLMFTIVSLSRIIITNRFLRLRYQRRIWLNVAVIGTPETIDDCIRRLNVKTPALGLKVMAAASVTDTPYTASPDVAPFSLDNPAADADRLGIEQFIIALPPSCSEMERMTLLRKLYPLNRTILQPAWLDSGLSMRTRVSNVAGEPLTDISSAVISESTRNVKRTFDVVISTIVLILLLPVFAIIAVCIKLNSRGPVFFSQERIGHHGKRFRIYKFRTMIPDAEPDGPALSRPDDRRITGFGRTLRKYRLDELPQFWNVLKGEMSIVGPRPEREFYEEQIIAKAPEYTLLHQLRPGITSWGMVKYGYASDIDAMIARMRYDIIYIENVSIAIDLKILLYTINTVITGKGI